MRIEHNYLKEYLDELHAFSPETAPSESVAPAASPFALSFVQSLAAARERFRAEKRADGLCMSVEEYNELTEFAEELAEIYDMDFLSEQTGGRALLRLILRDFDLSRDEVPERVEAFARLIARSDRLFLRPVSRYGEALIELALLYDLDE